MTRVVLPVLALALVLAAFDGSSTRRADDPAVNAVPAAASGPVKVVATGDIVCPRGAKVTRTKCRHEATARLTVRIDPDHVIPLGDLQYEKGRLRAFRRVYDDSWGAFKEITEPVPGNHEYQVPDANGFFGYFGTEAPGYYAWDAGTWRVYNLNSACDHVDCAAQVEWLRDDLAGHPRTCTMIVMHRPRYSSGGHGSDLTVRGFWRVAFRHGVDVALAGHDHDYERFLRMNHRGKIRPGRGILSFVSGTGGKSLYGKGEHQRGSAYFEWRRAGVLVLVLGEEDVRWRYRTIDRRTPDRGRRSCV